MGKDLFKITVTNRTYGELSGVDIYLSNSLHKRLSKEKNRNNESAIDLLKTGRAFRGQKHLISVIKKKNSKNKIVLTLNKTKK